MTLPNKTGLAPSQKKRRASDPRQLIPDEDRTGDNPALLAEAYNKVAKAAKLQLIMLTESSFTMQPEFVANKSKLEDGKKYKLSFGSSIANSVYKADSGLASCEWTWTVTAKAEKRKALSIQATYYILYDDVVDCEADAVNRYLRRVARFATYPYFRAHVSQVSWESGADLPILPTIST